MEREDESSGEEGEGGEEGEERRAREDPDEVLNESDDDDDSVRIKFLSCCHDNGRRVAVLFLI